MITVDTETTGMDFWHGARPFFVTACRDDGEQLWWEWDVNPLTRKPVVPPGDLDEIRDLIGSGEELVLQNGKFDVTALETLMPNLKWPWDRHRDTLLAAHLLGSSAPKDLTSLGVTWLGVDIKSSV